MKFSLSEVFNINMSFLSLYMFPQWLEISICVNTELASMNV